MKAGKLARILNKCSCILELFGDVDIEMALDEISNICTEAKKQKGKISKSEVADYHTIINDEYIKMLAGLNRTDLDKKLLSEDIFKNKAALLYLADQLGISSAKRQSMENLRYYISSYFERARMDDIIKNDRVTQLIEDANSTNHVAVDFNTK